MIIYRLVLVLMQDAVYSTPYILHCIYYHNYTTIQLASIFKIEVVQVGVCTCY